VIIDGGSRENARHFAEYLSSVGKNESIDLVAVRGLMADDARSAFREMELMALGARAKNWFYAVSINPRPGEELTHEQARESVDRLKRNLALDGQPDVIVKHVKIGRDGVERTHFHAAIFRIGEDGRAISDSFTAPLHEQTSRELEEEFGLAPGVSILVKDRGTPRPERRPRGYEYFRVPEGALTPQQVTERVSELHRESDTGRAFAAALDEAGYILARGDEDRRGGRVYCIVDGAGDAHSLARRARLKAAALRAFMADVSLDGLPSIAEAREIAEQRAAHSRAAILETQERRARRIESAFLAEPQAEIDSAAQAHLAARFGEELRPGTAQGPELAPDDTHHQAASDARGPETPGAQTAEAEEMPPRRTMEAGAAPQRLTSWGSGWRAFADRARAYASELAELWRDESSGGRLPVLHALSDGLAAIWSRGRNVRTNAALGQDAADLTAGLVGEAMESPPPSPEPPAQGFAAMIAAERGGRPETLPDGKEPEDYSHVLRLEREGQREAPGERELELRAIAAKRRPSAVTPDSLKALIDEGPLDFLTQEAVRKAEANAPPGEGGGGDPPRLPVDADTGQPDETTQDGMTGLADHLADFDAAIANVAPGEAAADIAGNDEADWPEAETDSQGGASPSPEPDAEPEPDDGPDIG
jgi:hypothetical protein